LFKCGGKGIKLVIITEIYQGAKYMKLQELIDQTDLEMTEIQVKAFFLGVLCAEKPLSYPQALGELLEAAPGAKKELEEPLKKLWEELRANTKAELGKMFPENQDINAFIEVAKDQLDYFLTALSLSGTNPESCKDEDLAEHIEDLEEIVEDMDEYLTDEDVTAADGADLKEFLLENWAELVSSKK
jgi:uncharacterized protein YgfB (UPF0149 family)